MAALFAFGAIADVQYADADDGYDRSGKQPRCFRGALDVLSRAVDWFAAYHAQGGGVQLSFVAQLGDIVDGQSAQSGKSTEALQAVMAHIRRSPIPFVNLVGNPSSTTLTASSVRRYWALGPRGARASFTRLRRRAGTACSSSTPSRRRSSVGPKRSRGGRRPSPCCARSTRAVSTRAIGLRTLRGWRSGEWRGLMNADGRQWTLMDADGR